MVKNDFIEIIDNNYKLLPQTFFYELVECGVFNKLLLLDVFQAISRIETKINQEERNLCSIELWQFFFHITNKMNHHFNPKDVFDVENIDLHKWSDWVGVFKLSGSAFQKGNSIRFIYKMIVDFEE